MRWKRKTRRGRNKIVIHLQTRIYIIKKRDNFLVSSRYLFNGRNEGIRTPDPYHPKVVHYQAVLRPGKRYYTRPKD